MHQSRLTCQPSDTQWIAGPRLSGHAKAIAGGERYQMNEVNRTRKNMSANNVSNIETAPGVMVKGGNRLQLHYVVGSLLYSLFWFLLDG